MPALSRLQDCGRNAERGVQTRTEIADRHTALDWRSVSFAGHAHHPAHALYRGVECAFARIRASVTVTIDRAIDEFGRVRAQGRVAETEAAKHAGAEVLDDRIGFSAQLAQPRDLCCILEINRDAAFISINRREIFAIARA